MAKAYQCDRCGKFFCKKPSNCNNYAAYKHGKLLDLCEECQDQLFIFLDNSKSHVEQNTEMDPEEGELYDNEF